MERAGKRIKDLRQSKGITQEVLADLWGTTQDRICKIENGRKGIEADEYLSLEEFLLNLERVASFTFNYNRKEFAR